MPMDTWWMLGTLENWSLKLGKAARAQGIHALSPREPRDEPIITRLSRVVWAY